MDRFHARAAMAYWTILAHSPYVSSPFTPAQQFEKLYHQAGRVELSTIEEILLKQKLIVSGGRPANRLKVDTINRKIRWPSMISSVENSEDFSIKPMTFSRNDASLRRITDAIMNMPYTSMIGQANFAILETLWELLGKDGPEPCEVHHEPWLIIRILYKLVETHPELNAGDVYCVLHSSVVQNQWLDKLTIMNYPEETYYQRKRPLRRPSVVANNKINHHQVA
jgi:hypothetical protein